MITGDGMENNRTYRSFRSTLDMGMGAIYIFVGVIVLYGKYNGAFQLNASLAYFLGAIMVLYGIFRIYRGLKEVFGKR